MLVAGFIELLKGWWDNYLTEAQRAYILPATQIVNGEAKIVEKKAEVGGRRGLGRWSTTSTPPLRSPAPTADAGDHGLGSGLQIGSPRPRIDRELEFEILVDSGAGATNRRPQPHPRGFRCPLWVSTTLVVGSWSLTGDRSPFPFLSEFSDQIAKNFATATIPDMIGFGQG
ncbi:hypothetical protein CRG98_043117 [Punica granatum]|uniref:DUF7746 domain-containing protein n=1 Tax=Punica granatum TaxID=22663 RepID=A0A2I0HXP4_PUNGR|nr:hypothetical protein CRG98_043117 [Punica granatum]